MAHTKAEIIQSRINLESSIKTEISIHRGYIAALENALRGMQMVSVSTPAPGPQHLEMPRVTGNGAAA